MAPASTPSSLPGYDHASREASAREYWQQQDLLRTPSDAAADNFYCLAMFPYPSGELHMGHVRNYSIADAIARFRRMQGYNVLHPMGWDAFGLPAENAAIQKGVHPGDWTDSNIEKMRAQLRELGFCYDWQRELKTCAPDYYRWEQWLFVRLFRQGLIYRKKAVVNWDPVDQTVLANEQVEDGLGWRSGAPVERREIPQWFLAITSYAGELLDGLDNLAEGWPKQVLTAQRNWIGRSEGARVHFPLQWPDDATDRPMDELQVFTTRLDTLMGCTALAIAPDHPLTAHCPNARMMEALRDELKHTPVSGAERAVAEKKGVPSGLTVRHPITGELLPVWVANFVLMEYGTGTVMMVPAHDQRDWEFARAFDIPIRQVIEVDDATDLNSGAETRRGRLVQSGQFDGLDFDAAVQQIGAWLEKRELGSFEVQYRLRDWCISRQRYWGAPIPIIHCPACGEVPVPEQDLPVQLPLDIEYSGPASPLCNLTDWLGVPCPQCGAQAQRETDTFDTFVDSSWYFARFVGAPDDRMVPADADDWLPVDQYVGGIEHAVLHLLYARFFHKLMRDQGLVSSDEPFRRLLTQGMVLNEGAKMSKSKGNTVSPQALIERYGADTVRLFMLFAAPPEQAVIWSEEGVQGAWRFINRFWRKVQAFVSGETSDRADGQIGSDHRAVRRVAHEALRAATAEYSGRMAFNTIIASVMELLKGLPDDWLGAKASHADRNTALETLRLAVLILSPITPHLCHHLWRELGGQVDPLQTPWPAPDSAALERSRVQIVVQVNGKVRGRIEMPAGAGQEEVTAAALELGTVQKQLGSDRPDQIFLVPDRLINLVAKR